MPNDGAIIASAYFLGIGGKPSLREAHLKPVTWRGSTRTKTDAGRAEAQPAQILIHSRPSIRICQERSTS